jgi:3-isopropylmalate/(R)-2-methylmalate dehydratase large subunit
VTYIEKETMRHTIAEKILQKHAGKRVRRGDIVIADVDMCFGQDVTSGQIIDSFKALDKEPALSPERFCMVMDHYAPSPNIGVSGAHDKMRTFSREYGFRLFDIGEGVSHQILPEHGYMTCGDLVIGADSHTCTYGALNVLSTGVGATDIALALAGGRIWLKVPESMKIILNGELPKGVCPKDVILHIAGTIGNRGAADMSIEFHGDLIAGLSVDERFTLTNMCVDLGAECALMEADKKTLAWLKKHCEREAEPVSADTDARYAEVREFDVTGLHPQVALPGAVDRVVSVEETLGAEIDQVHIGTCANGRLEDLETAAKILKNREVYPGTKLIITPASREVYLQALKAGLIDIFVSSGAIVNNPGCGPCAGTHQGLLADGETAFSTSNRNFRGLMGSTDTEIYLGSPATAAATAIKGKISDPREHKRRLC